MNISIIVHWFLVKTHVVLVISAHMLNVIYNIIHIRVFFSKIYTVKEHKFEYILGFIYICTWNNKSSFITDG